MSVELNNRNSIRVNISGGYEEKPISEIVNFSENIEVNLSEYTIRRSDDNRRIRLTSNSDITIYIPTESSGRIRVGSLIRMYCQGSGSVTLSPMDGVTLVGDVDISSIGRYGSFTLIYLGGDSWCIEASTALSESLTSAQKASIRSRIGLPSISFADFGSVGDGVTDDTEAVQAAFDAASSTGKILFGGPGVFRLTEQVYYSSGITYIGAGATILVDFTHEGYKGGLTNTEYDHATDTTDDVEFYDLWMEDPSDATENRSFFTAVCFEKLLLRGLRIKKHSDGWSTCFAGDRLAISDFDIDTYAASIYGDGLHLTAVWDAVITNGRIYTDDDCIALYTPPAQYSNIGPYHRMGNILVSNVTCIGKKNSVRIGMDGLGSHPGEEEDPDFDWGAIQFVNCHIANGLQIRDRRSSIDSGATRLKLYMSNCKIGANFQVRSQTEGCWDLLRFTGCDFDEDPVEDGINIVVDFDDKGARVVEFYGGTINRDLVDTSSSTTAKISASERIKIDGLTVHSDSTAAALTLEAPNIDVGPGTQVFGDGGQFYGILLTNDGDSVSYARVAARIDNTSRPIATTETVTFLDMNDARITNMVSTKLVSGTFTTIAAKRASSGAAIADDEIYSFVPSRSNGLMMIWDEAGAENGLIYVRTTSSPAISLISGGASVAVGTGALTDGTSDGTDGKLNVAATENLITIKNRMGASRSVRWYYIE